MSIVYRETGSAEMVAALRALPGFVQDAIVAKLEDQAARLSRDIKDQLSGPLLQARTGRLRASIYARVYSTKNKVSMSVGSRGDVPYAELQEDGGVVAHPGVSPSKVTMFVDRIGAKKFTRGIAAHSIMITGRRYVKGTVEADRSGIIASMRDGVMEAVRAHRP